MTIKSVMGNNAIKPPYLNQMDGLGQLAKGMTSHFFNIGCKIKIRLNFILGIELSKEFLSRSCNMSIWLNKVTDQEVIDRGSSMRSSAAGPDYIPLKIVK